MLSWAHARAVKRCWSTLACVRLASIGSAAGLGLALAAPVYASSGVPDWVRNAAHQTLPTYPETTKAVVLLDDTTYTVGSDGKATEHER